VESLLLWAIARYSDTEIGNAITIAASLTRKPDAAKPESWDLSHYIEVAVALKIISESTATQPTLANEFATVHPGKEKRTKMRCDRGTARSVAAAVDFVVRELTEHRR
jgi:hypothetical protein